MNHSEQNDRANAKADAFTTLAKGSQQGFVRELLSFLFRNKKWWLGPIVLVLLLVSFLTIMAGTSIAPFIYTLF